MSKAKISVSLGGMMIMKELPEFTFLFRWEQVFHIIKDKTGEICIHLKESSGYEEVVIKNVKTEGLFELIRFYFLEDNRYPSRCNDFEADVMIC